MYEDFQRKKASGALDVPGLTLAIDLLSFEDDSIKVRSFHCVAIFLSPSSTIRLETPMSCLREVGRMPID